MHESSLKYLRCAECRAGLELEKLSESSEIEEGFLHCKKCSRVFPVISKLPILWNDFSNYVSSRKILGGRLYRQAVTKDVKEYIKSSLSDLPFKEDRTHLEDRWARIYQNNRRSKFYSVMSRHIRSLSASELGVEYGCSIGTVTEKMSERCSYAFGVDRSFSALLEAKKSGTKNTDYVVADVFSDVFGKTRFELVIALNVLEIVEPFALLKKISRQVLNGTCMISDPYDFERGANSVKTPLDEQSLRKLVRQSGFEIIPETETPSEIPWHLKLHSRVTLNYKVDLVIGKKVSVKFVTGSNQNNSLNALKTASCHDM